MEHGTKVAGAVVVADASDRVAWLEARKNYLTASEVAIVLGLNSSKTRAALLKEKAGKTKPKPEDDPGDLAMVAAGRFGESCMFEWFKSETMHTTGAMLSQLLVSPTHGFLAATPDALLDGEPVEIKIPTTEALPNWHVDTTPRKGWPKTLEWPTPLEHNLRIPPRNLRTAKDDAGTPKGFWRDSLRYMYTELLPQFGAPCAPIKYWVQLQVQMNVVSAQRGWVVGAIGGTSRYDLYYARDEAFQIWMLTEARKFWSEVEELKLK